MEFMKTVPTETSLHCSYLNYCLYDSYGIITAEGNKGIIESFSVVQHGTGNHRFYVSMIILDGTATYYKLLGSTLSCANMHSMFMEHVRQWTA